MPPITPPRPGSGFHWSGRNTRRHTTLIGQRNHPRVQGREWHQVETNPRPSFGLRLPDNRSERRGRADPSQGHAGDPDHRGGMRRLDARAVETKRVSYSDRSQTP